MEIEYWTLQCRKSIFCTENVTKQFRTLFKEPWWHACMYAAQCSATEILKRFQFRARFNDCFRLRRKLQLLNVNVMCTLYSFWCVADSPLNRNALKQPVFWKHAYQKRNTWRWIYRDSTAWWVNKLMYVSKKTAIVSANWRNIGVNHSWPCSPRHCQ